MNLYFFFTYGILYLAMKFLFNNDITPDLPQYSVDLSTMSIFLIYIYKTYIYILIYVRLEEADFRGAQYFQL